MLDHVASPERTPLTINRSEHVTVFRFGSGWPGLSVTTPQSERVSANDRAALFVWIIEHCATRAAQRAGPAARFSSFTYKNLAVRADV